MNSVTGRTEQQLISEGQGLVQSLVSKIVRAIPVRVDRDDLVAYGEVGLAEAARDFDPEHGVNFTTFAYHRVRGAIYDGLSKMSWSSRAQYRRMKYRQMSGEVLAAEASTPGPAQPATPEEEARWLRNMTHKLAVVFFASQGNEEGGIRDSTLEDPQAATASTIIAQQEIVLKLHELIAILPDIEERLIRKVYFEGATLQEAANSLGISKSWASRLHAKSLEQLARSLRRLGASE
jgi:RNA polymerase sigma factor for flagellar operon FliA